MPKYVFSFFITLLLLATLFSGAKPALAIVKNLPKSTDFATSSAQTASNSATATISAEATAAAQVAQAIVQKNEQDITVTTSTQKDKLVEILDKNPIQPLSWYNFLQHAIRRCAS